MRGGWTFGEVNPRRINSAAWSRYASGSPERRVNPCSSLQPSGREKALQRARKSHVDSRLIGRKLWTKITC